MISMRYLATRLLPVAGILAAAAACERGDVVSPAGGPEGRALLISGNAGGAVLPSGSADARITLQVDPSIADAFARKATDTTVARRSRWFRPAAGLRYYHINFDIARNGTAATIDPRFPHIQGPAAVADGADLQLYQPAAPYPGDEYWELFGVIGGLTPSTPHQIAFVHRRLKVAGTVDHAQRLLQGTVTQPDTLVLGPGVPAIINTDWTGAAPVGCAPFPGVNSNPFIILTDPTDANGALNGFDKCWLSGNGIWTAAEFDQQTKSMIGRNDNTTYSLPNYNYLEVWEGAFGVGILRLRIQLAQDLDPAGNPIPNTFAPFPAPNTKKALSGQTAPAAVDQAASFPLPYEQQVALPATFGAPDSVIATFTNLQALTTGTYRAWYVNPTTDVAKPAPGRCSRTLGTTVTSCGSNSPNFSGGPGTITFTTVPYSQIGAADISDSLSFLLITIEQDPNATTPSLSQPLWVPVIKKVNATVGGAFSFGELNLGNPAPPERFTPQGTLSGGVIGGALTVLVDTVIDGEPARIEASEFVGSVVELRFSGLMRPPVGYEYRGYLCGSADGSCNPADATTTFLDLGSLVDPDGEPLTDSDIQPNDSNVSATRIVTALLTYDVAQNAGDSVCQYDRFQLILEPKDGSPPPLAPVFNVQLPATIRNARQCR